MAVRTGSLFKAGAMKLRNSALGRAHNERRVRRCAQHDGVTFICGDNEPARFPQPESEKLKALTMACRFYFVVRIEPTP
jgi:hypothetical protein